MPIAYLGNTTPPSNTETQILAESADYDYFVSVVCANKGLGEARVSVYAKAVGEPETSFMYFVKDQVVGGNTTFETKKLHLADDHALYVKSSNQNVSFACTGLRNDKIIE